MEVRIESMICVWDDAIPTMFIEFVNLLTLTTSEEGLRKSVKEFAEKHELEEALQKYPEQSFAQKFSLCNRQKFSWRKIKEGF